MRDILVIAPHPDDETLGCGGTLLKHREQGDRIHWVIVTGISEAQGFSVERVRSRALEIDTVAASYGFATVYNLQFPTTRLDEQPMGDLVAKLSHVFGTLQPEVVYLPYRGDVHTDHKHVFDAVISCTKWFRYPSVKRVLAYETLSETDFGLNPDANGFRPNVFVDISLHLDRKLEIMSMYAGEMGAFPFPRSEQAIRGLAAVRGAAAGCAAAESFMLLREIDV